MVLAAMLMACTGSDDTIVDETVVDTTTTTTPTRVVGDGRLVIGALLPLTDTLLGEPMVAAVESAIDRVNDAGGVLDQPVRLVVADEGSSTASATTAIQTLLERDVDAIIGPASSLIALSTLDESGLGGQDRVLTDRECVGARRVPRRRPVLPHHPERFTPGPSDRRNRRSDRRPAGHDRVRRRLLWATRSPTPSRSRSRTKRSRSSAASPSPPSDDDLSAEAEQLANSDTQVLILLADGDDGTRFLEALDDEDTSGLATIVVNDAFRNPTAPQRIQGLDDELRGKIIGLAPQADSGDADEPFDPPGLFAVNAYDCVNLITLATVRAGSDASREIARQIGQVSVSGSVCETFDECLTTIESGLQIDYNGPSGVTDLLTRTGDPSRATFDQFVFDDTGRDVLQRTIIVGN